MQNNSLSPFIMVLMLALVLLSVVAIFYMYLNAKSRERLALIEKGMNPNLSRSDFWPQVGIIGGGAGLGLMVGDWIPNGYGPLLAILFAGAGLVVFNVIRHAKISRDSKAG